jgi:hypothetical protein
MNLIKKDISIVFKFSVFLYVCSDESLLFSGARGLNVRKSINSECKLQKHFEEIRTFNEGGRVFVDVTRSIV